MRSRIATPVSQQPSQGEMSLWLAPWGLREASLHPAQLQQLLLRRTRSYQSTSVRKKRCSWGNLVIPPIPVLLHLVTACRLRTTTSAASDTGHTRYCDLKYTEIHIATGLTVSSLGIGAWSWGDRTGYWVSLCHQKPLPLISGITTASLISGLM